MSKYNLNEISNLFELHTRSNVCEFNDILSKIDGAGKRAATRMIYMRLLAISVNSKTSGQNWILKPKRSTILSKFEEWFVDETSCGIKSKDLLIFFKASTYKTSFKFLIDSGLIFTDKFNKMWIKYPVNGKMLSLNYAAIAIKASYKKESSLDTQDEDSVESDAKAEKSEKHDEDFWRK